MSSGSITEEGDVTIEAPSGAMVWNKEEKLIQGGHEMSEDDFNHMCVEASGQFACLTGRLMQLIEAAGLPDKQERSLKRFAKKEIYERLNDFEECMFANKRGEAYPERMKPLGGMPLSEE